jgi:hypothetical protein
VKNKDGYGKEWITRKSTDVLAEYQGQITLRQLYYRLVVAGMTNDINHYKRVIGAMTDARWDNTVDFEAFVDREREMASQTKADVTELDYEIRHGVDQVNAWMQNYSLNRWENQPEYIEVWIEKKALQGVFESPCLRYGVGLAPCKGYPSLTFLHDAKERFQDAEFRLQDITMLYAGDYDPSGEDIPRSIKENLARMGVSVEVERIALTQDQIDIYDLPSVPAKSTDTRSRNWTGDGVVELDAIEPNTLKTICENAINSHFDQSLYEELQTREEKERKKYRREVLKQLTKTKHNKKQGVRR